MFDVLLAAYFHKVRWYGFKVASVRRINTVVLWLEVDDLINDGLFVGAQQSS